MNPPYSQSSPAIYKAMLEFCKGKNVVLLVKYTSAVEAAKFKYECLFKLASVENTPKPVAFVYIDNKKGTVLDQPLVLIYLLQPEVWQHIMLMDSQIEKSDNGHIERPVQFRRLHKADPSHVRNVRAHM